MASSTPRHRRSERKAGQGNQSQWVNLKIFLRKQKAVEASYRPRDGRRWAWPNKELAEGESPSLPVVKFNTNSKIDNGM